MEKFEQYRVFVQVAEMESFIKAARVLQLPRATVSAAIQQLELSVGTRLLHRTTRKVCLTADGTRLLERTRQLLADISEVDQLFHTHQTQVAGRLDVDVPSRIARRLIAPALPDFLRDYPALQLALGSTDRAIDLIEERVDCVVRFGTPHTSSLVARPLGRVALINCASPGYLATHGTPEHPNELTKGHVAVGYAPGISGAELPWQYMQNGIEKTHVLPADVVVNNAENYIACCCAGLGLIQVPRFDVQHLINAGALVEVMPRYRPAPMEVSVLYPDRRQRSRRLSVFIEWFGTLMSPYFE
ncbi:LysR family transcriptional regulator [Pseudomonas costantinii]|uniref:LysR substrate-binding domain-containing protein n=1 Tax=Pseudomonas costantinii TaxID=168469 RepID=UPI0015A00F18|nr:LysR family transcriptional regulator [Pseudomonas costantinii]NVZ70082.1 LysR family transcriptional regulator [Pseudomonas costantinii]